MGSEPTKNTPKPKTAGQQIVTAVGAFIAIIIAVAIIYWIYQFIHQNFTSASIPKPSPSSSYIGPLNIKKSPTPGEVSSGNWTLEMTGPIRETGIQTDLSGTDTGSASFTMPAGGQTANIVGNYSGEASGVVGSASGSASTSGKLNITAKTQNNKLKLNVTFVPEQCSVTITTPLGTTTSDGCVQGASPDPHDIEIDIKDGATATSTVHKDYNGYQYTWTENWTLKKAQ